jgi:hypothetical protein
MVTVLLEQPWIVGAVGTILTVVTLYGWTQTGNAIAFKIGIGFALGSILLMVLNLWIVTDAEQVRSWLVEAAAELESNQADKVLKRLSPNHSDRVANAAERMKMVKFTVARITKIHSVKVDYQGANPIAYVRMNVFVEAESAGMSGKVPRWVGLTIEKKGKEWLIVDFEDREAQHEFMNSNSISEAIGPSLQGGR